MPEEHPSCLLDIQIIERPEIVELFFSALLEPNDVEALPQFLSPRVEWILSAGDPQTLGKESPPNALYMRESLHVISGDLTGCITHHQFVFAFGRVRLQSARAGQLVETNIAAKITFQASKIIIGQIRISWPLVF